MERCRYQAASARRGGRQAAFSTACSGCVSPRPPRNAFAAARGEGRAEPIQPVITLNPGVQGLAGLLTRRPSIMR